MVLFQLSEIPYSLLLLSLLVKEFAVSSNQVCCPVHTLPYLIAHITLEAAKTSTETLFSLIQPVPLFKRMNSTIEYVGNFE